MPGFPVWASVQAPIKNHEYFKTFAANSIEVPGPETQQLCDAAREHGIFVSIGISERSPASVGCLWNSNLLIGADGAILTHHRKLVPTFYEKLIWANGDGEGLVVRDTEIGKLGMLICGENTNPLARYSLIAQGEQIHISSYPPVWPTRPPNEPGRYDLAAAIRIRAGAHSFEGKVFNIVSSACPRQDRLFDALRGLDRGGARDPGTKPARRVDGAGTVRRGHQRHALRSPKGCSTRTSTSRSASSPSSFTTSSDTTTASMSSISMSRASDLHRSHFRTKATRSSTSRYHRPGQSRTDTTLA